MSARIPARRLGQPALAFRPRATYGTAPSRSISLLPWKKSSKEQAKDALANPTLDRYFRKHNPNEAPKPPKLQTGKLSEHPTSLWKPELEIPGYRDDLPPKEIKVLKEADQRRRKAIEEQNEIALHSLKLDPAPGTRRRFERRMVIRDVSRHQRITKAIKIARTERELLFRSHDLPTSTKKLTRIMHLIAGKTVEEAMVQLRFSKKRIARDVLKGLQIARDEAVAKRGMGLGLASSPLSRRKARQEMKKALHMTAIEAAEKAEQAGLDEEKKKQAILDAKSRAKQAHLRKIRDEDPYMADGSNVRPWPKGGELVELKDGKKKRVHDPTEIYIDRAWVGKGDQGYEPDFRARGRANWMTNRTASFSVLLKEEKTRLRIAEEIQKKRDNRKLWLPLPDRPVTSQRQYCLW